MRATYTLLILFLTMFFVKVEAQVVTMRNGTVSACGGVFYDSGGESGNYRSFEDYTLTICSDNPLKAFVSLDFEYLNLNVGDEIWVYDGRTTSDPLLASASFNVPLKTFLIQATPRNRTGCLTIRFRSDLLFNGRGWAANISCIPACQPITAILETATPPIVPQDTGYINLCLTNPTVTFKARGEYPQNGLSYRQSDSLSKFEWNFGDGSPVVYGSTVTHTFSKEGGFNIRLTIIDTVGCKNNNHIKIRARIAPRPTINLANLPSQICAGAELTVRAKADTIDNNFQVSFRQNQGSFQSGTVRSGRLFIPDDGTQVYKTSMTFSDFDPGQTLTNVNDLLRIFVDMEHTWARDLEIKLTCPNQQNVVLHRYQGQSGNRIIIGTPNVQDDIINTNDSLRNPPGTGARYSWTATATRTWNSYTTPDPVTLNPALNYRPDEPFTRLLGCPLNGTWSLEVRDLWPKDNGWIFAWGIDFDRRLYPTFETFKPTTTNRGWVLNPNYTRSIGRDTMVVRAKNAGTMTLNYRFSDNFGCTYDTGFNVTILPSTFAACSHICDLETYIDRIKDTTICVGGGGAVLDKSFKGKLNQSITFEAFPNREIDAISAPVISPFSTAINVLGVANTTLTAPLTQIDSVCFDIGTNISNEIIVDLQSPTGQTIRLFNRRGGSGPQHSLKNLCFSPAATQDIATAPSPYSGLYQPEGGAARWNMLTGSTINGPWQLLIADAAGVNKDTVNRWSITFRKNNGLKYTWTPIAGLSCTDCDKPTATPSVTTSYFVTIQDSFNCIHRDTIVVNVVDSLPAPNLSVANLNYTFIIFEWQPVSGAIAYEVSINGGAWIRTTSLNYTVNNLSIGQNVNFRVRAVSGSGCGGRIATLNQSTKTCSATIGNGFNRRLEIDSIPCFGMNAPIVNFRYANGEPPLTFKIDNIVQVGQPIFFDTIKAGWHTAVIIDGVGCTDTLRFHLGEPNPVTVSAVSFNLNCTGANDGRIVVSARGGVGGYQYQVRSNTIIGFQPDSTFNNLSVGMYEVEVQDSNFCTATTTVEVKSPSTLNVQLMKQDNNCFGGRDGLAEVLITGGVRPYTVRWSTGDTTERIENLRAGNFDVTVSDANNCIFTETVTIDEGAPLLPSVVGENAKCYDEPTGVAEVFMGGGVAPYIFSWSNGATGSRVTNLSAGTHTVFAIDALGCRDSATVTIGQPDSLRFDNVSTIPTSCSSTPTGSATVVVSGGTQPYDYLWEPGFQTTPTATALAAGTYRVTVVDANGCLKTTEATVTSPSNLAIQRFNIINPSCFGQNNGSIGAVISGGTGTITYQWSTNPVQTTTNIRNLTAGRYTLTVTDGNGCTFSKDTTLTQPTQLLATITSVQNVRCFGGNDGSITPSVTGGVVFTSGMSYRYAWSDPAAQTTAVANNLMAGSYTLTITDANGCTTTTNATVSVPSNPLIATATPTKIACFGKNDGEATVTVTGGTPGYRYYWSNGTTSRNTANLSAQDYVVTVTDLNGCQSIDTITISTYDNITVRATLNQPRCHGDGNGSIALNSVLGGAGDGVINNYVYLWNTSPNQTSPNAVNLRGNRSYSLTVTDTAGCQMSTSFNLPEPSPITLNPAISNVSCFGRTDGRATINVTGPGRGYTYLWSGNAGSQTTQTVNNLGAGNYLVTVTEDSTACRVTATILITEPPRININSTAIRPASCSGTPDGKISVAISGGLPTYTYVWSNGVRNRLTLDSIPAGAYVITVTDAQGCTNSQSFSVVSPNALDADVETTNVKCFGGFDGIISVQAFGGTPPYAYSANNGQSFAGSSKLMGIRAGNYTVAVKDAKGCIWKQNVSVSAPPQLVIKAMPDVTIKLGDSVQLSATATNAQGGVNLTWRAPYSGTLSCTACPNPTSKPNYTIVYGVFGVDSMGCRASDSVKVIVEKPRSVFVPTGFTPNGDRNNDNLYVRGKNGTKILTFRIYDRWGELLHESRDFDINDPSAGWDGTFKGQMMTSGVYVWYIEAQYVDGEKEILKGNTTLIR